MSTGWPVDELLMRVQEAAGILHGQRGAHAKGVSELGRGVLAKEFFLLGEDVLGEGVCAWLHISRRFQLKCYLPIMRRLRSAQKRQLPLCAI